MKLLLIYCRKFGYTPTIKTVENSIENVSPGEFENIQTAFIKVEKEDMEPWLFTGKGFQEYLTK